ncbi:MAG: DUF5050 domain-containing protein [Pyrinomonadaceae bacterium]|nr:DUF5050 domain-containing protein [Pyrinomonadaceae bacterium]
MNKINLIMVLTALLTMIFGCGESKPKEWHQAKPLTEKLDHPRALAADEKNIYFVLGNGTVSGQKDGNNNVAKIPLGGGNPAIIFKGGELIPDAEAIALDEENVYFSANGLRKVSKNGGEAKLLTSAFLTSEIVLDKENIYWLPYVGEGMQPTPIYTVSKNGGEAKAVTDPRPSANGLAIDEKNLYWVQTDGIYKMVKNGGNIEKIYTIPNGQNTTDLKMDSENFYFRQGTSYRELYKLAKTGGEAKQISKDVSQFWLGENEIVLLRYFYSFQPHLIKTDKNGQNEIEIDQDGYLSDLVVGKNKIYLSDVVKIYELAK